MTIRRYAGFAVSATVLAAGLAAAPAAAAAPNEPDAAELAAGTETDPQTGKNRQYLVGQGEDVPAVLGVTNLGDAPVNGLVVHVRILNDLDFTKKYENCWYAVDSNQESAWCEFDEELAPGASLAVTGAGISTKPDALAENISSIIYRWVSKKYVDERGGIQVLADEWAGQGTKAVRGTGDALTLTTPAGPLGGLGGPIGFAGVKLVTPPTSEPTATPTPTVTPSATTTVAPTPASSASLGASGGDGGEGGGLPVTGADSATLAGVGGALLLLGGVGYLITRRRRTRFVA